MIIAHSRGLWRHVFAVSVFLLVNPHMVTAQDPRYEYQGYYSRQLKTKIDKNRSRIDKNLKSYRKSKSVAALDESYDLIIQSTDEIYTSLKTATQQVIEIPSNDTLRKTEAQIDKLEIITIRDTELPYICNQLYEVGQLYVSADKNKARQCFKDIVAKFCSYESESCKNKAENALENLK